MALTNVKLIQITDKLATAYRAVKGSYTANGGAGIGGTDASVNYGASTAIYQLGKMINGGSYNYAANNPVAGTKTFSPTGMQDIDVSVALLSSISALQTSFTNRSVCAPFLNVLNGLSTLITARGLTSVGSLDTYLSYNNVSAVPATHTYNDDGTGTSAMTAYPFNCLVHPDFAEMYNAVTGQTLSAWNVYAPASGVRGLGATTGYSTLGTGLARGIISSNAIASMLTAIAPSSVSLGLANGAGASWFANNQLNSALFANPADASASTNGFGIDASKYAGGIGYLTLTTSDSASDNISNGTYTSTSDISIVGYWRSRVSGKLYLGTGVVASGTAIVQGTNSLPRALITPPTVSSVVQTGDLLVQVTNVTMGATNPNAHFVIEVYTPTYSTVKGSTTYDYTLPASSGDLSTYRLNPPV